MKNKIDKWVIATESHSGLGFAMLIQRQSDQEVIMATNPEKEEKHLRQFNKTGQGIIQKIPLEEVMKDKAKYKDYGFIWDGNHSSEESEILRKEGFNVLGGHRFSYWLENNREFGLNLVKKAGIDTPPSSEFNDIKGGLDFLEQNFDKSYVFKPDEKDQESWTTTTPDNDNDKEANKEMIRFLASQKEGKGKYILQERKKGVEINIETWLYKGKPFFAFADFECKRKDDKDLGRMVGCSQDVAFIIPLDCKIMKDTLLKLVEQPEFKDYTGFIDMNLIVSDNKYWFLEFCFDDETEIMTKDGWKLIKDVPIGTEVATLNRKSHELEYQKTTDLIIQDYNGDMVTLGGSNASIDAVMTPNHHQYAKKFDSRKKKFSEWKDIEAKDLSSSMVIKRDALWKGHEIPWYIIPEYVEKHYNGRHKFYFDIKHPEKIIAMDDWLRLLAYYLSEGSMGQKKYVVQIAQTKFVDEFEKTFKRLPFKYLLDKKGFRICSVQLAKHFSNFGLCSEKKIPDYVKTLSPRQIRVFLDAYCLGDGSRHKRTGQISYFTTSKIMSDDLQELVLKSGSFANIKEIKTKGTKMSVGNGKIYTRKHNIFVVSERKERNELWLTKKHIGRKKYDGKVYCVTVPNHTIYVRKNGKAFWSGNCGRFGYNMHPNLFMNLAIDPFSEIISDIMLGNVNDFYRHFRKGFGATITAWIDKLVGGLPLTFENEDIEKHFYHYDSIFDGKDYFLAGYSNEVGLICSHDYDVKSSADEALRIFGKIHYPGRTARTDLNRTDYDLNPIERYVACESMRLFQK